MKTTISLGREIRLFLFLFCIFSANHFIVKAQQLQCGTIMEDIPAFDTQWQQIDQSNFTAATITNHVYVIKVHFWQVNPLGGNAEHPLTETQMLDAIAKLNRDYNAYNIFFKFDGMTEFESGAFYELYVDLNDPDNPDDNTDEFVQFQKDNNYYHGGTINYYSVNDIDGDPVAAYYLNNGEGVFATIVSRYNYIGDITTVTHEVGHFFHLKHTFHVDSNTSGTFIENVTRYFGDGCFNADYRGDEVVDSNATPVGMLYNTTSCSYTPNGEVDECNIAYNAYGLEPEVKNFMSYTYDCRDEFTFGQVVRMRNFIEFIESSPSLNFIETHSPSILYEPYKGIYYFAGPMTAEYHPMFQYGFTYKFIDVSQAAVWNQPSPYEYTSFWTGNTGYTYASNYNQPIEHFNHFAFMIVELGDATYRKCYNNANRMPSGGNLINFIDGYPNANYTITPQDSTAINNPLLIDKLNPGLYNIQKYYEDGTTQQTMILKENN